MTLLQQTPLPRAQMGRHRQRRVASALKKQLPLAPAVVQARSSVQSAQSEQRGSPACTFVGLSQVGSQAGFVAWKRPADLLLHMAQVQRLLTPAQEETKSSLHRCSVDCSLILARQMQGQIMLLQLRGQRCAAAGSLPSGAVTRSPCLSLVTAPCRLKFVCSATRGPSLLLVQLSACYCCRPQSRGAGAGGCWAALPGRVPAAAGVACCMPPGGQLLSHPNGCRAGSGRCHPPRRLPGSCRAPAAGGTAWRCSLAQGIQLQRLVLHSGAADFPAAAGAGFGWSQLHQKLCAPAALEL